MSLSCVGYYRNRVSYMIDVMSSHCGYCLEKNLKCSLVVTQDDSKQSHKIFYFLLLMVSLEDGIYKQKLFLQEKLDKAYAKDAKLQVEELALIKKLLVSTRTVVFFFSLSFIFVNS